jgi:2-amino-4-hydroxy-6-hydroxymethyldihydropteridine diphosphokinase
MIFLGVGANLAGPGQPNPLVTCEAALLALPGVGIRIEARSPWYESEPVPRSDQPWYVNAVLRADSDLAPDALLTVLHAVEARFGRTRGATNSARSLDLDLLDHQGRVSAQGEWPTLPHPRMRLRAFVLLPLRDLHPAWRHPRDDVSLGVLIDALPDGQEIRRLPE